MKKFLIYSIVVLNIFVLIYLWFTILYTAFTRTPIEEALPSYAWWIFFLITDIWTWKTMKIDFPEIKKKLED